MRTTSTRLNKVVAISGTQSQNVAAGMARDGGDGNVAFGGEVHINLHDLSFDRCPPDKRRTAARAAGPLSATGSD